MFFFNRKKFELENKEPEEKDMWHISIAYELNRNKTKIFSWNNDAAPKDLPPEQYQEMFDWWANRKAPVFHFKYYHACISFHRDYVRNINVWWGKQDDGVFFKDTI
jgi:hypothetical protein